MEHPLFNDQLDDTPDKTGAGGFVGYDELTEPTKLAEGVLRAGLNMYMDSDLLAQTRPGLRFNTQLSRAALGGFIEPLGAGYYDVPAREAVLVSADAKLIEITGSGNNATSNVLTPTPSGTAIATFAQLVDRMFWSDGTLHWSMYSGGAWSHGTRTTFSDASAMPTWGIICAHGLRLMAYDPAADKIYASAIGAADAAANWVPTDNIKLGWGEGDPVLAMISGQGGYLVVIKERSAWYVDTSDASVANWSAKRITALTGARAGRTAVQIGQDVYFLSNAGVVSLGALADSISINPQTVLSTPVQPLLDQMSATYADRSFAFKWRDFYVLVYPVSNSRPNRILAFNTTTKQWATPWRSTVPTLTVAASDIVSNCFTAACTTNFGGSEQALLFTGTGVSVRLDRDYEYDEYQNGTTQHIESHMTIRACDHEVPEAWKQPLLVVIEWYKSTAQNVQINLVRDGLQAYPDIALASCKIIASGIATNALATFPVIFPWRFQANAAYTRQFPLRGGPLHGSNRYKHASIQLWSEKYRMKVRAVRLVSFIDAPDLS